MAVLLVKVFMPDIKIDAVTLGILAIAILPWLSDILKSVELPGGLKIELQDVSEAGNKVLSGSEKIDHSAADENKSEPLLSLDNPNIALISLRIEIERTLRAVAKKINYPLPGRLISTSVLLQEIFKLGHIDQKMYDGLAYIIQAANAAAHGAEVDSDVLDWVKNEGYPIIQKLQAMG